ncbi:MAG: PEGA domain-containing protein, partial [Ignavibacteriales bacterium]|nr:PEGA domain-containing protein [Ignavibacteriales bacterium]
KAKENPKIELLKIQNCKNVFIQSVEAILQKENITFKYRDITIQPEDKITNENNTEKENKNAIIEYGGLYIDCIPWADIYIDNKKIETTPLSKNLDLKVGSYELKLINPDFPVYTKIINIKKNDVLNLSVNLENLISFITFKIYPWGKVYIDGEYLGDTPFSTKIKLSIGKHLIVIKNPEYEDFAKEVTLKENENFIFEYRFE